MLAQALRRGGSGVGRDLATRDLLLVSPLNDAWHPYPRGFPSHRWAQGPQLMLTRILTAIFSCYHNGVVRHRATKAMDIQRCQRRIFHDGPHLYDYGWDEVVNE